jgi:hemolysin III
MMSALQSKVMREKQDDDNDQEYPDQPVARATKPLSIFSAAYNLVSIAHWKVALQRCDHAAIFVMIACTYLPFAYAKMTGPSGLILWIIVWSVALLGAGAKLTLGTERWERLSLFLYIGLGWAGLLFIRRLIEAVSSGALLLLVLGGLAYTAGVIFHVWEKLPYQNSIWHLFVLAGTSFHFLAVVMA